MTETIRKPKWISTVNEKFCLRCGTELIEKVVASYFDTNTGTPVEEIIKICPRMVERSFLWWKWQELCGYTNELPEM